MSSERGNARSTILEAAFALLQGGVPFRLEDVAKAAGVSRQAIYLHFRNRNDLIVAVADHSRSSPEIVRRLEAIPPTRSPRALLETMVHAVVAIYTRGAVAQLTVEALCRSDADLAAAWAQRPTGRIAAARQAARRLEAASALSVPVDRGAELLHALLGPGLFDQLIARQGWTVRAYETHLSRLLLLTLVVPGKEDVELTTNTRRERGTDARAGRDAGADAGSLESRRRRGLRRPVHR